MAVAQADNRRLLGKLLVIAVGMFGFGFALVPFYQKFCQVSGINDLIKPAEVKNTQVDQARTVTVQFDANIRSELPWSFTPEKTQLAVHPGQLVQVVYDVESRSDRAIVGQAVPSYGPSRAADYFNKLECFCFKQQTFQPGEKRRMPVVFVIDPKLPADVHTITLSYSFFEVEGTAKPAPGQS
ncbi:cytochrome c oxidase assembly protein [Chitinimonas koreensis]|uniref:cytochrome c oxidase assembly protein n=1 Tax=Chitinimonas koreensis TaxID=356302 RepID=UPI000404E1A1|nr:cytochrome c oxidase assembly protein [Chitinimonas koreensis]QNM96095.1 cytochrome c oxidase assembly protein [Chitinimonas koreensis]